MTGHFKVVYIEEREEVEPVPHSWEVNGTLYWPPTHALVRQLQSNPASKPDKTWMKYKCTVKEDNILLFMHATATADAHLNTTVSETSSDEDKPKKWKKTPSAKSKHTEEPYDFHKYTKGSQNQPKKTSHKANEPEKIVHYDNKVLQKNDKSQRLPTDSQDSREVFQKLKANQKTNSSKVFQQRDKGCQTDINDGSSNEKCNEISDKLDALYDLINLWKDETKDNFATLAVRLDRVDEKLVKQDVSHLASKDEEALQIFPIRTAKNLLMFNKDLEDRTYMKKMFNQLHRMVGTAMPSKMASYRLCNELFTKELLTQFSWTGMSRGNAKQPFNKLVGVLELFYRLIYRADNTYTYPQRDAFFRDGILKHSKTRLQGGKQKSVAVSKEDNNLDNSETECTEGEIASSDISNAAKSDIRSDVEVVKEMDSDEDPFGFAK